MSAPGARSKAEDIAEDIAASIVREAKQLEPCGDERAPNDEADTDTLSEHDDTGERTRKPSSGNAKNETAAEKTQSTGTGTCTGKSLHELGFTDEQIAAILSSTEVSGLKSASNGNSNGNDNAGEDEIAHLKSLSAALVRTRDSLNRNAQWLGGDEMRIVASPAESRRLVSSAQEAISCLSRVVRSRGLQDKFVDKMDRWDGRGRGRVPVQESAHRSSHPMFDVQDRSSAASRGAVHEWRNTVPVGAPKPDVVRPAPKRRFGLILGKRGLDK